MLKLSELTTSSYLLIDINKIKNPNHQLLIVSEILKNFEQPKDQQWLINEVFFKNQLIALSISAIFTDNFASEILSFVVHPEYRQQGIGLLLLQITEQALINKFKRLVIAFNYLNQNPYQIYIEKIIKHLGWSEPKVVLIRYFFDVQNFTAYWLNHLPKLSANFQIINWNQINQDDHLTVQYLTNQGRVLRHLSPFHDQLAPHLKTSFGFRQEGSLKGWIITHLIDNHTLKFSSLFMDTSIRNRGLSIYLLAKAINKSKKLGIQKGLFEIDPREIDSTWIHFILKRLAPQALYDKLMVEP